MDNIIINLDDGVTLGNGSLPNLFEQTDIISQSDAIVGPAGPQGPAGKDGKDGQAATITVGTTTTGAAGTNAQVQNSGTSSAAILNFTIPRGDRGETGATGATGDTGPAGADGQAATITVGSVQTVAPEYPATVTNSGTTSAAVLDFEIPRGLTGETGPAGQDGADGQAATITVGTTTTGAAGTNASVTNSGTSSAAVFNFTIPRGATGDTGPAGADGNDGQAATITVGTTTTGAAGTNASVTNSGTSSAAVLNFTIPRGDTGATAIYNYGLNSTQEIGIDIDDNRTVYRTVLGSNSFSLETSKWKKLGNVFDGGSGTVLTVYSIIFVLRDSSGNNFCSYGYDGGAAGSSLGSSRPLLAKVLPNGDVLVACLNDNFGSARLRVTIDYTKQ